MGSDCYYLLFLSVKALRSRFGPMCRPEPGKPTGALLGVKTCSKLFSHYTQAEPIGYHRKRKILKEGRHFEK
jgi:hypothetical protein